jgi:hypothetical protein
VGWGIIYDDSVEGGVKLKQALTGRPLMQAGPRATRQPHFQPRPSLHYQAVPARPATLSCQVVLGLGQNRPGLVPPVQPGPFGHL